MDLIIKTQNNTIDELTPKEISWNKEQVRAFVEEIVEPFTHQVFTDQTIPEAKEAHAKLNNFSKRLTSWRIEQGKVYLAPYEQFKQEVADIANIIDTANARIDAVIKEHQNREKENKRVQIEASYTAIFKDYLKLLPLSQIFNQKWFNAGYKMPLIEKELNDIKQKITDDLAVISEIASGDDKTDLEIQYFKTLNLSLTINEYKRKQEYKAHLEELRHSNSQDKADIKPTTPETPKDEQQPEKIVFSPSTGICEPKTYEISFKVVATKQQLIDLKEYFKANGIEYSKI